MSYTYAPIFKKVREKAMALLLLALAVALFVSSKMPRVPIPALWQAAALVSLMFSILLVTQYLLKRYTYAIEDANGARDLIITEYNRSRARVVCRVALTDIEEVRQLNPSDRKSGRLPRTAGRLYSYVGSLEAPMLLLLKMCEGGETVYVKIASDEALFRLLST